MEKTLRPLESTEREAKFEKRVPHFCRKVHASIESRKHGLLLARVQQRANDFANQLQH
jgi:hypothetical protein